MSQDHTRGARGPLVARVAVAVALPGLSDSRGAGAGRAHHVVPPAATPGALGSGVVQGSKLLGSFLQAEQKTRQVANDQGMQEGFSTGPGTSPVLPPARAGRRGWPRVVPSASAKPAACVACSHSVPSGIAAQSAEAPWPETPAHSSGSS